MNDISSLEEHRKPRSGFVSIFVSASLLVLVLFHCTGVLSFVETRGRLSLVPTYDDVFYLTDGLSRLPSFYSKGFSGFIDTMKSDPSHAPYSSILAVIGFVVTPGSAFGSYLANAVWVVVFVLLALRMLKNIPLEYKTGLIAAGFSVPLLATVLGSFRPDSSWGLTTGAMATILATEALGQATRKKVFFTGLLVGAIGLTKPTGLPTGAVVMATGYLGSMLIDLVTKRLSVGDAVVKSLLLLLGVTIVESPYLAVSGQDLVTYIHDVMFRDMSVVRTAGGLSAQLKFYIQPSLATQGLGWLFYVAPLVLTGLLVSSLARRDISLVARTLLVALIIFVSYLIPSLSPVQNIFFGSIIYGTVIAGSLWCAGRLLTLLPLPPVAIFVAGVLVFAVEWRPGNDFIDLTNPAYAATDVATRAVLPSVMGALEKAQDQGLDPLVYVASPGPVYDKTLGYYAAIRGFKADFLGAYTETDWNKAVADITRSSIVIFSEDGAEGQDHSFQYPILKWQDRLKDILLNNPKWKTIDVYTDKAGFNTTILSRVSSQNPVILSFGEGFLPEEQPSPKLNLPRFHWMNADSALIAVHTVGKKPLINFNLRCQAAAPLSVTVRDASGVVLGAGDLPAAMIGMGPLQPIGVDATKLSASSRTITVAVTLKAPLPIGMPGPMLCDSSAENE